MGNTADALGEVEIKRGIFQSDSLSPLLFVLCMILLSFLLRKTCIGQDCRRKHLNVNHLLFMDGLKLFGSSQKKIDFLLSTELLFTSDIGMKFSVKMWSIDIP